MNIISKEIHRIRYVSSVLNNTLNCEILLLFLEINNSWYKVSSCDGISEISLEEKEPQDEGWEYENDVFSYPVKDFNKFNLPSLGKLVKIEEYLYKGLKDESCGFLFTFDSNKMISVKEIDDCLFVDLEEELKPFNECILVEYKSY